MPLIHLGREDVHRRVGPQGHEDHGEDARGQREPGHGGRQRGARGLQVRVDPNWKMIRKCLQNGLKG